MKIIILSMLAGTFLAVFLFIGCDHQEMSQDPSDYPASLIVAAAAADVEYDKSRGAFRVHYVLNTPYPAAGFIAEKVTGSPMGLVANLIIGVVGAFVGGFLFGLLGLAARGLIGSLVTATRPPTVGHEWNGEWENAARDVLVYALSYRHPEGDPPDLSSMSVFAVHIPKAAAGKAKAHVDKF